MNFDLGIWQAEGPLSAAEASRIYASFCRAETPARVVRNSPAVNAFYADLIAKWPETGNKELCPWSGPLHHSASHVLLSCVWSKAENVLLQVAEVASRHGLVVFDPQSEEVYLPETEDE